MRIPTYEQLAPNFSSIHSENAVMLWSYHTLIGYKDLASGETTVARNEWGPTTGRHINEACRLLQCDRKESTLSPAAGDSLIHYVQARYPAA